MTCPSCRFGVVSMSGVNDAGYRGASQSKYSSGDFHVVISAT